MTGAGDRGRGAIEDSRSLPPTGDAVARDISGMRIFFRGGFFHFFAKPANLLHNIHIINAGQRKWA
jgi:hypothetical protein